MKKLTVSELRAAARVLQNRPRVSAMEDADFCASVLQLISDTRRAFTGVQDATRFLAQASSYASSAHIELSLATIQAVLEKVGPKVEKEGLRAPKGSPMCTNSPTARKAVASPEPANSGFSLAGPSKGRLRYYDALNVARLPVTSTVYRNRRLLLVRLNFYRFPATTRVDAAPVILNASPIGLVTQLCARP